MERFLKKKIGHSVSCENCYRTSTPQFFVEIMLINFKQGLQKCWLLPKMGKIKFLFLHWFQVSGCTWHKVGSLAFLKAKNEEKKCTFLRSLWFFERENFAARGQICRFFLIGLIKIYLIGSIDTCNARFRKSKKNSI